MAKCPYSAKCSAPESSTYPSSTLYVPVSGTCGSADAKTFSTIVADSVPPMQYLPPLTERVTLTDWMSDLPRTVVLESLVSVTRAVGCCVLRRASSRNVLSVVFMGYISTKSQVKLSHKPEPLSTSDSWVTVRSPT